MKIPSPEKHRDSVAPDSEPFVRVDSSATLGLSGANMSTSTDSSHAQFPALQSSQRLVEPLIAQAIPLQECVPWWLHVFQYSLLSSDMKLAGLRYRQRQARQASGKCGDAYWLCDRE